MDIVDISPRDDNTTLRLGRDFQSVSGKALCCALASDGARAYLGGHSGVWRSDDGGATWRHLEWPEPPAGTTNVPGSLLGTTIYDLLISTANPDIVFAAVGRDARRPAASGVWRSADGGATWRRVHQFVSGTTIQQANCLAIAPDDANLIYCAGGSSVARSTDAGLTWTNLVPQAPGEQVWYVAVGRRQGTARRVYAVGSRVWSSANGGETWQVDAQPISLGACGDGPGPSSRSIGIHPTNPLVLYVATFERNDAINNTEGIVWRGQFQVGGPSTWTRLPALPLNFPNVTDSGAGFVVPHVTPGGELYLISSDRRTVQFSFGDPAASSDWVRIEDGNCHLDPHGLGVSRDFRRRRPGQPVPPAFGRILLVNDGGANFSTDGAQRWGNGRNLSTLGLVNAAVAPQRGRGPGICMGMGDNSGFASPDGGDTWETQHYVGGDNDCAFADPRQPARVIVFAPRAGKPDGGGVGRGVVFLYVSPDGNAPNTAVNTPHVKAIPGAPPLDSKIAEANASADPPAALKKLNAAWSAVSNFYNSGYRPLILTPQGQPPPADVDFVVIRFTDGGPELVRTTKLSLITDANSWKTSSTADGPNVRAFRPTPPLPDPSVGIVQASGGHASPTFYVGDQTTPTGGQGAGRVWRWTTGMASWQQIIPAAPRPGVPTATRAQRFFVDPYRPSIVYVLGSDHVYRSDNGGSTWAVDGPLERALTEDGAFPIVVPNDGNPGQALVRDMLFDPARPKARFAVGPAGVFQTLDGVRWTTLFRSSARACRPNNAAYDFASRPRALYVATSNRGLLRLSPLAPDWDYPMNSLQAAVGRIELLRVHDVGTGFGPPEDQLDAEVIVMLDSEPEKAFGFKLRPGADEQVARGMLDLLRAAFGRDEVIRLEFIRTGGRTGRIMRVIQP